MFRKRHLVHSVIFILIAAVRLRADDIDDYIKRVMESQHIPGISIAVVKDGVLVKAEGYGLANLEHNVPARTDTVFKLASMGKQFIATGIMLLVQDGKLSVDDNLAAHLKEIPDTWQGITLRHLLTHTSGLVREGPAFDPYKVQPDIDVIRSAYSAPLGYKPGDRYEYSNLNYFVLGEIIHRVSGKSWGDFLAERVFVPLGMTNTRVTNVADIIPNRADGYFWNAETQKYQNGEDWAALRPSGGFLSTVLDLAKWEAALRTERILTASSKSAMWTWVKLNDQSEFPYGFGWQLNDWPADSPVRTGVPMIRHTGSDPGFRAGFFRWPTHGLAVIVLTNRREANVDGLGASIAIRVVSELKTAPQPAAR